jgi:hypothetical protein
MDNPITLPCPILIQKTIYSPTSSRGGILSVRFLATAKKTLKCVTATLIVLWTSHYLNKSNDDRTTFKFEVMDHLFVSVHRQILVQLNGNGTLVSTTAINRLPDPPCTCFDYLCNFAGLGGLKDANLDVPIPLNSIVHSCKILLHNARHCLLVARSLEMLNSLSWSIKCCVLDLLEASSNKNVDL